MKNPKKVADVKVVETAGPIPVMLDKKTTDRIENKQKSLAPNTTVQEDMVVSGQRRINMIWELTQALIAISITWAIIYMRLKGIESDGTLTNAFFLIVSMYFIRTNHKLIGGVGPKPANETR